jgi:hypothetical protein
MMMRHFGAAAVAALLALGPARAQFADQGNVVTSAAGTANAHTGTVANATSYNSVLNVKLIFVPANTNTGDATLTLNGFGTSPHFHKPTLSGPVVLAGGELVATQPYVIQYDGTYFNIVSPAPNSIQTTAASLSSTALAFGPPVNLTLAATVNSNALTISMLNTGTGGAPSAANPVWLSFRDSTIAAGDPQTVALTSALTFTIASGSTMGCSSGFMCRLWVFAINNGGTVALCAYNSNGSGTIVGLNEAQLQTSASGTSGGNSAQTLYCSTTAVTSKAVRYLGYIDIQESTAGTWATGPTYIQLFGPGITKPGGVIQTIFSFSSSNTSTGSGTFQTTAVTSAIIPTSAANLVRVTVSGTLNAVNNSAVNAIGVASIFRASTQIGTQVSCGIQTTSSTNTAECPIYQFWLDQPNTTSSVTYTEEIKSSSGTISFPSTSGGTIMIEEIMSALEPSNDNGPPLSMVG